MSELRSVKLDSRVHELLTRGALAVVLVLSCARCGATTPQPSPIPEEPPPVVDASSPVDAGADVEPAPLPRVNIELEPVDVSPVDSATYVEIVAPIAEQRVLVPKAMGLTFRLKSAKAPDGAALVCALDAERPHRYVAGMKLGDLLPDAKAIAEGPHVLTAAFVDGAGAVIRTRPASRAPFAMVRFWVGERQEGRPEAPRVVLLAPSGTLNGEAVADEARIDFLAAPTRLGVEGGRVHVSIAGGGLTAEKDLSAWQPIAIRNLPSGDFEVDVSLFDPSGKPLSEPSASARRMITVNRDAPAVRKQ